MTFPPAARYGGRPPGCSPCNRCGRPILFVRSVATGKSIPVEPVPDVDGTISAAGRVGGLVGWPISAERPHQSPNRRYVVHQALCPVRPGPTRKARRPQPPLPFDISADSPAALVHQPDSRAHYRDTQQGREEE